MIQKKTQPSPNRWRKTPPNEPGQWLMRCDETHFEPELTTVELRPDGLWVRSRDLGWNPLEHIHDGLTSTEWKKAPADEQS
jgi:hypothetical protein